MKLKHHVDIQVEEQVASLKIPLNQKVLKRAVLATLEQQGVTESCEVVVILSDDETLRALNRRFRGIDRSTDVLSFSDDTRGPFAGGSKRFPLYLGDIVLSVERAIAQADAASATFEQELQVLVIHGALHLLGYDHAEPSEKTQMWAAQEAVLRHLGIDISLPE